VKSQSRGGFSFISTLPEGLKKYRELVDMNGQQGADFQARKQMALQLLNVCNQGSANDPTVPPILTGNLRGSASVFVGAILIQTTRGEYGIGAPATSYGGPYDEITIVYDTSYAAKMHEDTWNPGPRSEQSGNVGNKWVEKHLAADGPDLLEMYALTLKRLTGG